MNKQFSELIILLDGVAILFIVVFHAMTGQAENPLFFLTRYLGFFGLSLFTFTVGYKLVFNHLDDLKSRFFLGTYFLNRFVRLYKPYLGYTLLIFFPVLITYYLAFNVFHLTFSGITQFFDTIYATNSYSILAFFAGDNPVTGHLWYLIALIYITAVCFTIMYLSDIRSLFYLFFPFVLFSMWLLTTTGYFSLGIVLKAIVLVPFFIAGMYAANTNTDNKSLDGSGARKFFPVVFLLILITSAFIKGTSDKAVLIFLSSLFLPFFLSFSFAFIKKITLIHSGLLFFGRYSFAIYLFHLPLILLFLIRVFIDILNIHLFFMPLLLAVAALYLSVIAYLIVRKCHLNFLIE
jgi:peptidoglycan/LPS O-acetylase OafA/YrhL